MVGNSFVGDWLPAMVAVVVVPLGGFLQLLERRRRAAFDREQLLGTEQRLAFGALIETVNTYVELVVTGKRGLDLTPAAFAVQSGVHRCAIYVNADTYDHLRMLTRGLIDAPSLRDLSSLIANLSEETRVEFPEIAAKPSVNGVVGGSRAEIVSLLRRVAASSMERHGHRESVSA